jgi:hypothetical protein
VILGRRTIPAQKQELDFSTPLHQNPTLSRLLKKSIEMIPPKGLLPDIPSSGVEHPSFFDLLIYYAVHIVRLLGVFLAEIGLKGKEEKTKDLLPRTLPFDREERSSMAARDRQ